MLSSLFVIVPILLIILLVLASAIKVVQEYERGVVFRLGRLVGPRGPGPDPADPLRRADAEGRSADRDDGHSRRKR